MDICRGVLRALFLDYPLSKVFDKVCGNVSDGDFLKPVEHLLRWRMTELTLTDTQAIVERLPQFGITECLIQYKCSVNTPPPHAIRSG